MRRSINEAIWSIYYFLLFFCIMVMWKPSENTAAYAYHLQVATDAEAVRQNGGRTMRSTDCPTRRWWRPRTRERSL